MLCPWGSMSLYEPAKIWVWCKFKTLWVGGQFAEWPAMSPRSVYFIQYFCDRCEAKLKQGRSMSFFSDETFVWNALEKRKKSGQRSDRKRGRRRLEISRVWVFSKGRVEQKILWELRSFKRWKQLDFHKMAIWIGQGQFRQLISTLVFS